MIEGLHILGILKPFGPGLARSITEAEGTDEPVMKVQVRKQVAVRISEVERVYEILLLSGHQIIQSFKLRGMAYPTESISHHIL